MSQTLPLVLVALRFMLLLRHLRMAADTRSLAILKGCLTWRFAAEHDAMLSSALKYGCTAHLRPHQRQLEGSKELGVPPLVWSGDTLANIQSMIQVAVDSLEFDLPEIKHGYYDFSEKAFCDASGGSLLDTVLGSWSDQLAGSGKTRAGISTLKRCILLRSLVRQEGSARPSLLEQVLREPSEFISSGDLAEIFY